MNVSRTPRRANIRLGKRFKARIVIEDALAHDRDKLPGVLASQVVTMLLVPPQLGIEVFDERAIGMLPLGGAGLARLLERTPQALGVPSNSSHGKLVFRLQPVAARRHRSTATGTTQSKSGMLLFSS